jgi:hypothetical protein
MWNSLYAIDRQVPAGFCGESCKTSTTSGTINSGIVEPPIRMADQSSISATASVAECCSRCKANPKCDVFEL